MIRCNVIAIKRCDTDGKTMAEQVKMIELPACDICKAQGRKQTAEYDAKTASGPWAYMCQLCWSMFSAYPGKLGTGMGQRLVLRSAGGE